MTLTEKVNQLLGTPPLTEEYVGTTLRNAGFVQDGKTYVKGDVVFREDPHDYKMVYVETPSTDEIQKAWWRVKPNTAPPAYIMRGTLKAPGVVQALKLLKKLGFL